MDLGMTDQQRKERPGSSFAGRREQGATIARTCWLVGGRYWDRTSDPFHVKEVLYR